MYCYWRMMLANPSLIRGDCLTRGSPLVWLSTETLRILDKVRVLTTFQTKLIIYLFSYSYLKMALFSGKSAPKPRQRLQKIKQDSFESACYNSSCKSICPKNWSHLTFILLYSVNINSASSPIWGSGTLLRSVKPFRRKLKYWREVNSWVVWDMVVLDVSVWKNCPCLWSFHQTKMRALLTVIRSGHLLQSRPSSATFMVR